VLNVRIAKDAHGAFAARPGTPTNDFFSRRTGEIDLTFVGIIPENDRSCGHFINPTL
jgi:hypothetical protein